MSSNAVEERVRSASLDTRCMLVPSGKVMVSTADAGRISLYCVVVSGWAFSKRGVYLNGGGGDFFFLIDGDVLVTSTESHR